MSDYLDTDLREPDDIQRVSGATQLTWKYKIEDCEPDTSGIEVSTFFEQLDDGGIMITIQQTKPGGRTYKHKARIDSEHLQYLLQLATA